MAGDLVQVFEGVKPGERVVTEGSFLLRAEAAPGPGGGARSCLWLSVDLLRPSTTCGADTIYG
jgi:hypothetical protein